MKKLIIPAIALTAGLALGWWFRTPAIQQNSNHQLTLEQILSIKELHLVRHHYQDLFFVHRKNNPHHSIRAIVSVPVTLVAYIDLKAITLVKENDTIRQVILPRAQVHAPVYELSKMDVRKTRSFTLHAGKDLYPEVSRYLAQSLTQRMDSIQRIGLNHKIIEQAEAEGKEYVEGLLKSIGRSDVAVRIADQ